MSSTKKKPPVMKARSKEAVNKKALIWIVSGFGLILAVMVVLLLIDK